MANHKQRGESASWQHLYKRSRWLKMRERHLMQSPLCLYCLEAGDVEPATICDHRTPHKGNEDLFWDADNLMSLCKSCHDRIKQREERGETVVRFSADGWPIG
ncbi:HNH endonuclease [Brucella anthropi]|uniref:HNH endonuclease n=1 Tax=Brucella anthropi TaxID=529 RepID=UPI0005BDE4EA|nr:HNH endonuclease [Brucella anthropi]